MLKPIKEYNNLSPDLRARLNKEREAVGRFVKYKFYIAHKNPDGQNTGGEYLYPAAYTLTPVTYTIIDPGDKMPKLIGMAQSIDRYGQIEEVRMNRITMPERLQGVLTLDLQYVEHI